MEISYSATLQVFTHWPYTCPKYGYVHVYMLILRTLNDYSSEDKIG